MQAWWACDGWLNYFLILLGQKIKAKGKAAAYGNTMKHYLRKYAEEESSVAAYLYAGDHTYNIWPQATQGKLIHILGWRREASWLAVLESMHERTGNWLTSLVANREKIYANWSSFDQGKEGNMHARLIRISTCITKCGWPSMSNMFFLLFLGKFVSCPIRTLH